jgi:hypothetical protein
MCACFQTQHLKIQNSHVESIGEDEHIFQVPEIIFQNFEFEHSKVRRKTPTT